MRSVHTVGDMYGFHELSIDSVNVSRYITINYERCSYCRWYVGISWTVYKFCTYISLFRCVFNFQLNVFPTSDSSSLSGLTNFCRFAHAHSSTLSSIPCSAFTGFFYIVPGCTYVFYMDRRKQNPAKLIEMLCINAALWNHLQSTFKRFWGKHNVIDKRQIWHLRHCPLSQAIKPRTFWIRNFCPSSDLKRAGITKSRGYFRKTLSTSSYT